jgi:hypothetical protein
VLKGLKMSTRRTDDAATVKTPGSSPRQRTAGRSSPSDARLKSLEGRVKDLEEQVVELETTFSSLEIAIVHGYFVKVWEDPSGEWIADCPVMKCITQEPTRDEALAAMGDEIPDMTQALVDLGQPVPRRDVTGD